MTRFFNSAASQFMNDVVLRPFTHIRNTKTLAARALVTAACLFSGSLPLLAQAQAQANAGLTKAPGTLSVAIYTDFAPFSDHDKGIDVDVGAALAAKLGLKLALLPFPAGDDVNDDLRNMVWKGHYMGYGPADVLLHVPVEPALKAANSNVTIFAPYYHEAVRLVRDTRKIPAYANLDSLSGKKIGVDKASVGAILLIGAEDGKFRDDVKIFSSGIEALEKLKAGEVDGVVANRSEIAAIIGHDSNFAVEEISFPRLSSRGWLIGMAVKKDNVALTQALQEASDQLIASGEMKKIFAQHGVDLVLP